MFLGVFVLIFIFTTIEGLHPVLNVEGDLNIAIFLDGCTNQSDLIPYRKQSLVSTAIWTAERIHFLESLSPLTVGLKVYEICTENDYFKTIFDIYENNNTYTLGILTETKLDPKLQKFSELLNIRTVTVTHLHGVLIKASIKLISVLGWTGSVTVLAPDQNIINEFYKLSKTEFVCVKECVIYETFCPNMNSSNPVIFFGDIYQIEEFVRIQEYDKADEEIDALFIPLDGSVPKGLPFKSFVVIPPHNPATKKYELTVNIIPSPTFIYTARAILTYTKNIEHFIDKNCNETSYKFNCLRSKFNKRYRPVITTPTSIVEALKIETLKPNFVYNVYRAENNTENLTSNNFLLPISLIATYNIFYENLSIIDHYLGEKRNETKLGVKCLNYFHLKDTNFFINAVSSLSFRSEAWVYAFLSLSLLGVLICISILIFLLVSICRRDVLEGNPVLTISLLVATLILFCSVLPFSLEENKSSATTLCLAKSLSITLGYATLFSLLLSRSILLATASKELGFMSHIAGPVQAFLCLFIFGVQAAFCLQLIGKCIEVFSSSSFLYLMSYNTILLLLLLCLCPLIYKSERNYREGRYFCAAIILTTTVWSIWLPLYILLDTSWNEPMLCSGLIATAGVFLGAIFIPRTYLMTISTARNKITGAFPSINTANSIVDIYRTQTQPIYDCVNVAAINAVNVARAGVTVSCTQNMQPDLYSCPALPDDEDFDFRCDSPNHNDKITRF